MRYPSSRRACGIQTANMNKTFVVLQIVLLQPGGHALRSSAVVADGRQRRAGAGMPQASAPMSCARLAPSAKAGNSRVRYSSAITSCINLAVSCGCRVWQA